jgi:transposase
MGASNFTYVEATWTQMLCDWIGAHTRTLAAIDGVPRLIVPENVKVASHQGLPVRAADQSHPGHGRQCHRPAWLMDYHTI